MANTLYLSHLAEAKAQDLSSEQYDQVLEKLHSLEQDPLAHSSVFSEANDLRIARIGRFDVILRYVPAENAVLVTDIAIPYDLAVAS